MAGLKYLLLMLLLVLGCKDIWEDTWEGIGLINFDPDDYYSCKVMDARPHQFPSGRVVWGDDCETGDECGEGLGDWFDSGKQSTEIISDCPVPDGLGVLVCELDTLVYILFDEPKYDHTINVCSCSCDLDG